MSKAKSKQELMNDAKEFLQEQNVAVLSTVDKEGQPHGATIFYYLSDDDDFSFYFFTKDLTKKFDNLDKNNRVALTVFTEKDPVIVQVQGTVWVVKDEQEAMIATSKLVDISSNSSKWFDPPISKMKAGQMHVLKVETTSLRYADFRQISSSPSPFHQIIP